MEAPSLRRVNSLVFIVIYIKENLKGRCTFYFTINEDLITLFVTPERFSTVSVHEHSEDNLYENYKTDVPYNSENKLIVDMIPHIGVDIYKSVTFGTYTKCLLYTIDFRILMVVKKKRRMNKPHRKYYTSAVVRHETV